MSDLAEFLLARIAEDEAVARAAEKAAAWDQERRRQPAGPVYDRLSRLLEADYPPGDVAAHFTRVLAECDAKRLIVEGMRPYGPIDDVNADEVLGLLALPYADHPDYREEWKP